MADAVLQEFPDLKTLADVGCGGGIFAAEFQSRGVSVVGCEYSAVSRKTAGKRGVATYPFDLSKSRSPLPGCAYQAVMTLEVGEHIPNPLADSFVAYLAATGNLIILYRCSTGAGRPRAYQRTTQVLLGREIRTYRLPRR